MGKAANRKKLDPRRQLQVSGRVLFAEKPDPTEPLAEAVRGAIRQTYGRRDLRRLKEK